MIERLKSLEEIRSFINSEFPDLGTDNVCFAVLVVIFSIVALEAVDPDRLKWFTGYNPQFVEAVLWNLHVNKLLRDGRYNTSRWLTADDIDDDLLCEEMQAAMGWLWFDAGSIGWTLSVDHIEYLPLQ